jgi:hypothetical protein
MNVLYAIILQDLSVNIVKIIFVEKSVKKLNINDERVY